MTSHFHNEFPNLHLIMGLYTIARLFKNCVWLPIKIIYTEKEFRYFAWFTWYDINLANHLHNIRCGLISNENDLAGLDAYRFFSYHIPLEHAVVPTDQCMFCKARGFGNLIRHIIMKHANRGARMAQIRHAIVIDTNFCANY